MGKKTRVTPQLIAKAKSVFSDAKKKSIKTNEGLTRSELRALERKELVRKMNIFGKTKFTDGTSPQSYLWEWIGD